MDTNLLIILVILLAGGFALLMGIRYLQRRSREAYKRIDWSRIREWKDDEE